MKKSSTLPGVIALSTLALFAMAAGCSKNNKTEPAAAPQPQPQAHSEVEWKLSLNSTCQNEPDEYCVGMYGFSVSADKRWEVGPAPNQQTTGGYLSDDEFSKVAAVVNEISLSQLTAQSCDDRADFTGGVEEKVTLKRAGVEKVVASSEISQFCYQTASSDTAGRLHDAIRELADRYYPMPFPDACAEASSAAMALYTNLQGCMRDEDCAYVGQNYDVIAASGTQFVLTDNCTMVRPMVAANAAALSGAKDQLLNAFAHAQEVCGGRIAREDCRGVTGFESSVGAPVCQQGVCRANPAASSLR